jgi:hypothetical protein
VWRNYYDLVGFHRNKATGELWLEPNIPEEVNHSLSDALVASPEGYITISATESGEAWQNQRIIMTPDQTLRIDTLYIKDKYGDSVLSVRVNGIETPFIREGIGHQRRLKIFWSQTVGPEGLIVEAEGNPILLKLPAAPDQLRAVPVSPSRINLFWRDNATNETAYRIESKIGGIFKTIGIVNADDTSFSHTGLLQNTEYYYRVLAYNEDGNSDYSNETDAFTFHAGNGDVVIAVNAGGPSYSGKDGIQYITDINAPFCTGGSTYETQTTISGTQDSPLYQTERYGEFSYHLPINNGNYEVTLKFAEIYFELANSRVFNVKIENEIVISELDIFNWVGKNIAYDVSIPIAVIDGTLDIVMVPIKENPKLCAFVVRKSVPNDIDDRTQKLLNPLDYYLSQNYPNPFNPTTTIEFQIPALTFSENKEQGRLVTLKVYDILGREVAILVNENKYPGLYFVKWNAAGFPSGLYFCQLKVYPITNPVFQHPGQQNRQTGYYVDTKKLILLE